MEEHQNNHGQKPEGILNKVVEGKIDPNSIGKIVKTVGKISGILGIIVMIVIGGLFITSFGFLTDKPAVPLPVGLVFLFFVLLMLILKIIVYRQISGTKLEPMTSSVEPVLNNISIEADEKVVDYVTGIIRVGWFVRPPEVPGVSENKVPENAMLITNKQVIFIVLPVLGANKVIAGADISEVQWFYSKQKIEDKLKEMIPSVPLAEIIKSHQRNFALPLSDIKVQFGSGLFKNNLSFLCGSKKYSYSLRDMKDVQRVRMIFKDNITS